MKKKMTKRDNIFCNNTMDNIFKEGYLYLLKNTPYSSLDTFEQGSICANVRMIHNIYYSFIFLGWKPSKRIEKKFNEIKTLGLFVQ